MLTRDTICRGLEALLEHIGDDGAIPAGLDANEWHFVKALAQGEIARIWITYASPAAVRTTEIADARSPAPDDPSGGDRGKGLS